MGQRGSIPAELLSVFPTELGWVGIAGGHDRVVRLWLGCATCEDVIVDAGRDTTACSTLAEADWHPDLRRRLQRYAQGAAVAFDDVVLSLPPLTDFQRRVIEATRQIPYGETISYGALAQRAGAPRAARAVGSVMAANRLPILIPCHRVIAADGGLGGYSAPDGTGLKARLLAIERQH